MGERGGGGGGGGEEERKRQSAVAAESAVHVDARKMPVTFSRIIPL